MRENWLATMANAVGSLGYQMRRNTSYSRTHSSAEQQFPKFESASAGTVIRYAMTLMEVRLGYLTVQA